MIVRPTISLTSWARRYGGSSTLLMNMPLKIKRTFGGARGRFFSNARSPLLVYRSGLWRSACWRAAWHGNAIIFTWECRYPQFEFVGIQGRGIYETAINWLGTRQGSFMR